MSKQKLSRNDLAQVRTSLAVDRTILSYLRTSLTIVVVGISLLKFFDTYFLNIIGWILIASSIIIFIYGSRRCKKISRK
jgi:putative membrane protein